MYSWGGDRGRNRMGVLTFDAVCSFRYWDQTIVQADRSSQRVMAGVVVGRCPFARGIHTSLDRHNCSLMACLSKRLEMYSFAMKTRFISNIVLISKCLG